MPNMDPAFVELATHALQNMRGSLNDLRAVIAEAQATEDVFPLWSDLRDVICEAMTVSDSAAMKCEQLLMES